MKKISLKYLVTWYLTICLIFLNGCFIGSSSWIRILPGRLIYISLDPKNSDDFTSFYIKDLQVQYPQDQPNTVIGYVNFKKDGYTEKKEIANDQDKDKRRIK